MAVAEEMGIDHDVVLYMKTPPDEAALRRIVAGLEDPVEDLVRKDARFAKLELDPDDFVGDAEAVVELLAREKALLQRPIIVKGDRAIIARPPERVLQFIESD